MGSAIPAADREAQEKRILAVIEVVARDLPWLQFELAQFEVDAAASGIVDIVRDYGSLSTDLRRYAYIAWSGHAKSDPYRWGGSYLKLGGHHIEATEILDTWKLDGRAVVTLAACESALDQSSLELLDEYCGIDLALRISGARSVISTLWSVRDEVAALATVLLLDTQLLYECSPGAALLMLQRALRLGSWKVGLVPVQHLAPTLGEWQRRIKALSEDAFTNIQDWAVFRCFGGR